MCALFPYIEECQAQFDPAQMKLSGSNIQEAVNRYERIKNSFDGRDELDEVISDTTTTLNNVRARLADASLNDSDRASYDAKRSRLERSLRVLQERRNSSATKNEVELAAQLTCLTANSELQRLPSSARYRPTPPGSPSSGLVEAATLLAVELKKVSFCFSDQQLFDEHVAYYQGIYSSGDVFDRQHRLVVNFNNDISSLSALGSVHQNVVDVVTKSGTVAEELSKAGQGTFASLANLGEQMQFFKEPEQSWERGDYVKHIGGAVSLLSGALYASGDRLGLGENPSAFLITSGLGAALYVAADAFKAGKIPQPLQKYADRVAQNRILGLAIQDLHSDLEKAKRLVDDTETAKTPNAPIEADALSNVEAVSGLALVVRSMQETLDDGSTQLPPDQVVVLKNATITFHDALQKEMEEDEQSVFTADDRIETALIEVSTFRNYVQTLHTAARSIREMLGTTINDHPLCRDPNYIDFCKMEGISDGSVYWSTPLLLDETLRSLIWTGNDLFDQYKTADAHLNNAVTILDSIRGDNTDAWDKYQVEAQRLASNIRGYGSAF
jgi:hypothetical protein